jgi:hypothetical protein
LVAILATTAEENDDDERFAILVGLGVVVSGWALLRRR